MIKIDIEEEFVSFSYEQINQFRKELSQGLSQEKLEVLNEIFTLSEENPAKFLKLWIQPMLAEG